MKNLEKICLSFLKMVVYDYDLLSIYSYSELAASIIYIAFKIMQI